MARSDGRQIPGPVIGPLAVVMWLAAGVSCAPSKPLVLPEKDAAADTDVHGLDRFNRPARCRPIGAAGPEPAFEEKVVQSGLPGTQAGVAVDIGFVDSDAIPDLLLASSFSNSPDVVTPTLVAILHGKGGGEFETTGSAKEVGVGTYPFLADFNADGRHDVVNDKYVSLATTSGRLGAPQLQTGGVTGRAIWGNVNGDDFVDLIVGTLSELHVRLGTSSGLSDEAIVIQHSILNLWNRHYVRLQDIDGDGFDDLIMVQNVLDDLDAYPPSTIDVWRNEGGKGVSRSGESLEIERGISTASVAYGDFNCDGQLDLVTVNPDERVVEVRLRARDGWELHDTLVIGDSSAVVGAGGTVDVGDVNGDGAHDLVVASIVATDARGSLLGEVEVFLGDGRGSFSEPRVLKSSMVEEFLPQPLAVGDIDGNGWDDIVVLMLEPDDVAVVWLAKP